MDTELIATIPFKQNEAIEYYSDRLIFNKKEIFYEDITGYSYSLTTYSHSINYIPTYNSKTVTLSVSVGNDKKPIKFMQKIAMPSGFHSKKQADLDIIFSEIIKITDLMIGKLVLNKLYNKIQSGRTLNIGDLVIEKDSIRKKGVFKETELEEYGRTYLQSGNVIVQDGNSKPFAAMALGTINAPLLGLLLDSLFRE